MYWYYAVLYPEILINNLMMLSKPMPILLEDSNNL